MDFFQNEPYYVHRQKTGLDLTPYSKFFRIFLNIFSENSRFLEKQESGVRPGFSTDSRPVLFQSCVSLDVKHWTESRVKRYMADD